MSGINNPYAQGGWSNPQNPWAVNDLRNSFGTCPPSIYGALPFSAPQTPAKFVEFQCTGLNPDILNNIVMGPNARHCYSIATSPATSSQPSITGIRNDRGELIARVEWHRLPFVEARELIARQYVSTFIPLSQDSSHRTMLVKGRPYAWTTKDGSMQLYNTAYNPAELLANISRTSTAIVLKVTQQAIHGGLLEVCVLVAVLLYSGRRIE